MVIVGHLSYCCFNVIKVIYELMYFCFFGLHSNTIIFTVINSVFISWWIYSTVAIWPLTPWQIQMTLPCFFPDTPVTCTYFYDTHSGGKLNGSGKEPGETTRNVECQWQLKLTSVCLIGFCCRWQQTMLAVSAVGDSFVSHNEIKVSFVMFYARGGSVLANVGPVE